MINFNTQISFFLLVLLVLILFLISIQFKIKSSYKFLKKIFVIVFTKREKNYTNENELIDKFIPQDEIKNLIQEDLPFIKSEAKETDRKTKLKLPSIDLLSFPNKKEKEKLSNEDSIDSEFLEKILLRFWCEWKYKKS